MFAFVYWLPTCSTVPLPFIGLALECVSVCASIFFVADAKSCSSRKNCLYKLKDLFHPQICSLGDVVQKNFAISKTKSEYKSAYTYMYIRIICITYIYICIFVFVHVWTEVSQSSKIVQETLKGTTHIQDM